MGETPDQIERHIYEKRSELGENIHELQQKVKTAVDWRAQFDQRPWVLMGAAFGGGMLLALLFGGRGDSSRSSSPDAWKREAYRTGNVQQRDDKVNAIWENIRGAAPSCRVSRSNTGEGSASSRATPHRGPTVPKRGRVEPPAAKPTMCLRADHGWDDGMTVYTPPPSI